MTMYSRVEGAKIIRFRSYVCISCFLLFHIKKIHVSYSTIEYLILYLTILKSCTVQDTLIYKRIQYLKYANLFPPRFFFSKRLEKLPASLHRKLFYLPYQIPSAFQLSHHITSHHITSHQQRHEKSTSTITARQRR